MPVLSIQEICLAHDIESGNDNEQREGQFETLDMEGPKSKTVADKQGVSSEGDEEEEKEIESGNGQEDVKTEKAKDNQDEAGSECEVELKQVESDVESEKEESDDKDGGEEDSDDASENIAASEEEGFDAEKEEDSKGEEESNDESDDAKGEEESNGESDDAKGEDESNDESDDAKGEEDSNDESDDSKEEEESSDDTNQNIAALFAKTLASRLHSAKSPHVNELQTAEEESLAPEALERDLSVGASLSELGVQGSTLIAEDTSGIVRSSAVNADGVVPGSLNNLHLSEPAPPVDMVKEAQRLKRRMKAQAPATAGDGWFGMGAPELTFEVKNDLRMIRNRAYIDPKRHYKKDKWKAWPKFFEMGTVIEGKQEFYSSRMSRRERKQTLAEEILADASTRHYMKRKFKEISELKPSKKKLKRKKKN